MHNPEACRLEMAAIAAESVGCEQAVKAKGPVQQRWWLQLEDEDIYVAGVEQSEIAMLTTGCYVVSCPAVRSSVR